MNQLGYFIESTDVGLNMIQQTRLERRKEQARGVRLNNGLQRLAHMPQRKNKTRLGGVHLLKQKGSTESEMVSRSVLFTGHFHPAGHP